MRGVEAKIFKIEGFRVHILNEGGRDLRSDRTGLKQYPYGLMLKNSATVHHWIERRFKPEYPGLDVEVVDRAGEVVHGRTMLGTVRDTYLE